VQILKNIKSVLEVAGGSMSDIVKVNVFLTNMSQYGEFSRAYNEVFGSGTPASAVYATPALVLPALLVEVEATAVIGSGD